MKKTVIVFLIALLGLSLGAKIANDKLYKSFNEVAICEEGVLGDASVAKGIEINYEIAEESNNVAWEICYDTDTKESVSKVTKVTEGNLKKKESDKKQDQWLESIMSTNILSDYGLADAVYGFYSPDGKKALYPLNDGRLLAIVRDGNNYETYTFSAGDFEWNHSYANGECRLDFDIKGGKMALIVYQFNYHYYSVNVPNTMLYVLDEDSMLYEAKISSNLNPFKNDDVYGFCHNAAIKWK